MATAKTKKALDDLAARFAQESIGAIEYAANARAIALQANTLRDALGELFDTGYRLTGVEPVKGYGASPNGYVLAFSLRKSASDSPIDLDETALYATIDIGARRVVRLDKDADHALGRLPADVPFVLAVPSRSSEGGPTTAARAPARLSESQFLSGLGILDLLLAASGDPRVQEQNNTFVDTLIDFVDTGTALSDTKTDYHGKIDGSHDPDNDRWVEVPSDRPVLVIPRGPGGPAPKPTPGPDPAPPGSVARRRRRPKR